MELNIKALEDLFKKNTNTSYKYIFFYSLIKIIKKPQSIAEYFLKEEITYKDIVKEMLLTAWLPSFQFNLNFREQDQIKVFLKNLTNFSDEAIKINKPTNKIIKKIHSEIDNLLNNHKNLEDFENELLHEVVPRLIRPFYKKAKGMPEAGPKGWYKNYPKLLPGEYEKEQPFYLINLKENKIILNQKWVEYIRKHYFFLELFVLDEWYEYMKYQNRNSPSLYEKLKFPEFQRNSLEKQRKFWKEIVKHHEIKCIFTNETLNINNFDIDHFICWNFLGHDQEWNLIPVLSKINRSKNNKIPNRRFVEPFVNFKIQSLKYAKSILSPKKSSKYLADHSNFINFSHDQCFTPDFKSKYNEEINSLAKKAKNQGYEEFNGR